MGKNYLLVLFVSSSRGTVTSLSRQHLGQTACTIVVPVLMATYWFVLMRMWTLPLLMVPKSFPQSVHFHRKAIGNPLSFRFGFCP